MKSQQSFDRVFSERDVMPTQQTIEGMGKHEMRNALAALRVGTHLKVATFARVAGLNRITVDRVEDTRGFPEYVPSYETISKWLTAAHAPVTAEAFIADHEKKTAQVGDFPTRPVHTLPLSQPHTGELHGIDQSGARVSTEDLAAILERLALDIWTASAALRGVRPLRADAPAPARPSGTRHPLVRPTHDRARKTR